MSEQPIEHPSSDDRPPAANQPSQARTPGSGAPEPTGDASRDHGSPTGSPGPGDATEGDPGPRLQDAVGGTHPDPGDPAGVSVPSDQSAPGTSQTARPVQGVSQAVDPDGPQDVRPA